MARLSKRHREAPGACSKPMWSGYGMPAGFCNKPAYGCPDWENMEAWERKDIGYVGALACPAHGGPTLDEYLEDRTVIRFDGPPGPEPGRFVEVERNGESIRAGEWVQDGDDWLLVLDEPHTEEE